MVKNEKGATIVRTIEGNVKINVVVIAKAIFRKDGKNESGSDCTLTDIGKKMIVSYW